MKKITALVLALLILLPFQSFAAIETTGNIQYYDIQYSAAKDQYILNYYLTGTANNINIYFISGGGTPWTKTWGPESINRTIFLNCNGEYDYYFRIGTKTIGYIQNIETSSIMTPICSATTPGDSNDDLNLKPTPINDGSGTATGDFRLNYTDIPGGSYYRLDYSTDGGATWTNKGENNGSNGYFDVTKSGLYRLTAYNSGNNVISRDIIGNDEFNLNKCDGCKTLIDMLNCPAWDDYMGEFGDMIAGAIPEPPSIEDGMDYLIDKLAEQTVEPEEPEAPEAFDPGYEEELPDLPEVIETDVTPSPSDFTPETTGTGSGPVILTDPGAWVPDDTDAGYNPPDPAADTAPDYEPPGGATETPPNYTPPGTIADTPPNYTPPGTVPDTPPVYTIPGGGGGGTIPDYDYE